jgi:histone H3/H4
MAEVETTDSRGATPTIEELQRKLIDAQERIRDLQHEAKDHRLARNQARRRVEELESAKPADSPAELEQLRRENRQLKHRGVFERVAREAGAKTTGKALDTLWDALKYDAKGEADPADLKAKIEAARPDYDFLFDGQGETPAAGQGETPPPGKAPEKRETPAARPGPGGNGRGAPADGAGRVTVRKSDLQSFDPAVNPMMDRHRSRAIEAAKAAGTLQYLDE